MKLKSLVPVLGILALAPVAFAADMESLFDEAQGGPSGKAATEVRADRESPMVFSLKKDIRHLTSDQNLFFRYVDQGAWEKAAVLYSSAFEGSAFQKSANGRAIHGLVQFRAGLPVTGVQTLFLADSTKEISSYVSEEWRKLAPASHPVWKLARVAWKPQWREVFGEQVAQRLSVTEALASPNNFDTLVKLSSSLPTGQAEKADIDWQLVLAYAEKDQTEQAGKLLAALMKNTKSSVSADLMQLTAARLLFQNGYFDAAVKYYEKVPKKSEYWPEAQEEMAWSYIRKGQPQNALAVTQSLVSAPLQNQVSPEAYFLRSLSQLKVCDYSGTLQTLQNFPKAFKERTQNLTKLATSADNEDVKKALALLEKGHITIVDLGATAKSLPRRLARDEKVYQFMQAKKQYAAEAKVGEELYARSGAETGLQSSFMSIHQAMSKLAEGSKNAAMTRVSELAKTEVEETKEILRKLHIVEAEVLQQTSLADKLAKNAPASEAKKGTTGAQASSNVVRYPAENEVWFDEVANYRVDVNKACSAKR